MSVWTLYWLTRIPEIKHYLDVPWYLGTAYVIALIGIVLTIVAFFISTPADEAEFKDFKNWCKSFGKWFCTPILAITILFETLSVFVPNERDMAIILGGAYVTNQEEIAKLPSNVAKVLNGYLEKLNDNLEEKSK